MGQIKYLSVIEYLNSGKRLIVNGKSDREGTHVKIPTPDNDLEDMARMEWVRVGVYDLPEPMSKQAFKEWWNDRKDDDPQPSPIPEVLSAMEERDDE